MDGEGEIEEANLLLGMAGAPRRRMNSRNGMVGWTTLNDMEVAATDFDILREV